MVTCLSICHCGWWILKSTSHSTFLPATMHRNMFFLYKTCTFPYVHVAGVSQLHRHGASVFFLVKICFPWSRPHLKWPEGWRKHSFTKKLAPEILCSYLRETVERATVQNWLFFFFASFIWSCWRTEIQISWLSSYNELIIMNLHADIGFVKTPFLT